MKFLTIATLAVGACVFAAAPSSAANLLTTSFSSPQFFSAPGNLKIFKSGSFFQAFVAPAGQTVMISFSAVCATGGSTNQATRIRIIVNEKAVAPTDKPSNIFCSADGQATTLDGQSTNTLVTSVVAGSAASNSLRVEVVPVNDGVSMLDDVVINVWN